MRYTMYLVLFVFIVIHDQASATGMHCNYFLPLLAIICMYYIIIWVEIEKPNLKRFLSWNIEQL